MYRDIPEDLRALIEPIVEDYGLELVDAEVQRTTKPGLLRVTVDQPTGDGRVAVDVCAKISRELGTHLDATDSMGKEEAYQLEVSSPGLDRVLGRTKDFEGAIGAEIKIATRRPISGRRRFRGRLVAFGGETATEIATTETAAAAAAIVATIKVDGTQYEIPFGEIEKANAVYEFSASDFQGSRKGPSASRQSKRPKKESRRKGAATQQRDTRKEAARSNAQATSGVEPK